MNGQFRGLSNLRILSGTTLQEKPNRLLQTVFLSTESFGRSTFASVAEFEDDDLGKVERSLTRHFVERYGAPDEDTARPAAQEEAQFVIDLCKDSLINTIFTVQRRFSDDGQIKEEFRTIKAPDARPLHTRIWNVVADDE